MPAALFNVKSLNRVTKVGRRVKSPNRWECGCGKHWDPDKEGMKKMEVSQLEDRRSNHGNKSNVLRTGVRIYLVFDIIMGLRTDDSPKVKDCQSSEYQGGFPVEYRYGNYYLWIAHNVQFGQSRHTLCRTGMLN